MKEITEQQIRQRANEIGRRPAFPCDWQGNPNGFQNSEISSRMPGMTYRQYLIGQAISSARLFSTRDILGMIDVILTQLAKAELEAENNLSE